MRVHCLRAAALSALPALAAGAAFAHGTHEAGRNRAVAHLGGRIATLETDDTLTFSLDFEGYFSGAVASGWRTGEPLGAGGKMNHYYSQNLHLEGPFDRPELARKDYWPQYRDFSYIPLWQPTQFGVRGQYRFHPALQATVSVEYFAGSIDAARAAPNVLEFEEYYVRWTPPEVPGLSLSVGHLLLAGSYAPPFDQFPLEFFQLNGLELVYARPVRSSVIHVGAAAGRVPVGRTTSLVLYDSNNPASNFPVLDGVRERNSVQAHATLETAGGLSFGLLGGYQVLPADQTTVNSTSGFAGFPNTLTWPRASGWQMGAEAGLEGSWWEHHLVVSHGRGDVEMAWGAPDYTYQVTEAGQRGHLIRAGSALTQAVYWGGITGRRLGLSGGVWGQWRDPAQRQTAWPVMNKVDDSTTSVTAATQRFRAVKAALEPRVTFSFLSTGVRLDGIRYLDKTATTNTVEPLTDQALRPVPVRDAMGNVVDVAQGPSPWEREAVDCLIVSPFVQLGVGDSFHLRASWSGAWYGAPVHRQRQDASFHGNVTLTAWVVYRFGVPARSAVPAGPPPAPDRSQ